MLAKWEPAGGLTGSTVTSYGDVTTTSSSTVSPTAKYSLGVVTAFVRF